MIGVVLLTESVEELSCVTRHVVFDDATGATYYPTREGLCRESKDQSCVFPYPEGFVLETSQIDTEITSFALVSATGSVFMTTSSGRVAVFSEDDVAGEVEDANPKYVKFESGIVAAEWSPDGRFCALLHKDWTLCVTGEDLVPISDNKDVVRSFLVEKGAAASAEDCGTIAKGNVSWRADSECFSVGIAREGLTPLVLAVNRFNVVESLCQPPEGYTLVSERQSWRPSGDVIAAVCQKKDAAHEFICVLFERVGLARQTAAMPSNVGCVVAVSWSANSDNVAITFVASENKNKLVTVILGTSSYEWIPRTCFAVDVPDDVYNRDCKVLMSSFDAEDSCTFRVIAGSTLHLFHTTDRAQVAAVDEQDTSRFAAAAVISGASVSVTYLARELLPPPMGSVVLKFNDFVTSVAMYENKPGEGSYPIYLAVQLSNNTIEFIGLDPDSEEHPANSIPCATVNLASPIYQMMFISNKTLVGIYPSATKSHRVCVVTFDAEKESVVEEIPLKSAPLVIAAAPKSGEDQNDAFVVQVQKKYALVACSVGKNIVDELPYQLIKARAVQLNLGAFGTGNAVVSLTAQGKLLIDQNVVSDICTSYFLTSRFLVFTTVDHYVHFFPRSVIPTAAAISTLRDHWEYEKRDTERGAVLVAAVHTSGIVMQIPRGNLELVYPRALGLDTVRLSLSKGEYGKAFTDARRQRIDLNLICDYNLERFLADMEQFIRQVKKPDQINVFLSGLTNEDTTVSKFVDPSILVENTTNTATTKNVPGNKINAVCDRMRTVLQKMCAENKKLETKYLLTLLTTFAVSDPPRMEDALALASTLSQNPDACTQALEYLAFLCDVDMLVDVALGMYDIPLARRVAALSQQDPREYKPLFDSLEKTPLPYRCFRIDSQLGHTEKALKHILDCGLERHAEALAYIQKTKQYKEALDILLNNKEHPEWVCELQHLFADYLSEQMRHEQAGILYDACGAYNEAMEEFSEGLFWKEAITSCLRGCKNGLVSESRKKEFICSVADKLEGEEMYKEAALVYTAHLNDSAAALRCFTAGRMWHEAWDLCQQCPEQTSNVDKLQQELIEACNGYGTDLEERKEKASGLEKTMQTLLDASAAFFANGVPNLTEGDFDDASSMTSASTVWTKDSAGNPIKRKKKSKAKHSKPSPKLVALTDFSDVLPRTDFQEELGAALRVLMGIGNSECVLCAKETQKYAKNFMDLIPPLLQLAKKLAIELDKEMACTVVRKMGQQRDIDESHMVQFASARTTIFTWSEQDWSLDCF